MSTGDYLLISSTRPLAETWICSLFGSYKRIDDYNGRPAYMQLHSDESKPAFLYYMSSAGAWLVDRGDVPVPVPVPAPDLTMTLLPDLSSDHCSDIIITATGEAARLWPECLGTFSSQPGEFYCGRQVFRNTTGWKLRAVGDVGGFWVVCDGEGWAGLRSGSAPGMCPADPRARVNNEYGTKNWGYRTSEGYMQESSAIIITCTTQSVMNISELEEKRNKMELQLKVEKDQLQKALQYNLVIPNDQDNTNIVERISRSIQMKKEAIDDLVKELECPVCLDTVQVPVFTCEFQHIICSSCRGRQEVTTCPECRTPYPRGPPRRHRFAERELKHLRRMREELVELTEQRAAMGGGV